MTIQLLIIIIYFALTVGIGLFSSKRSKTSDSFHGAGLGMFAIVCASTGEWLGGTATTGVSEYGFTSACPAPGIQSATASALCSWHCVSRSCTGA